MRPGEKAARDQWVAREAVFSRLQEFDAKDYRVRHRLPRRANKEAG